MKKRITLAAVLAALGSANAATITVESFRQNQLGFIGVDAATGSIDETIADGSAQNGTDNVIEMTYTGLTLDGTGSGDDSVSLSIVVTGTDYDSDGVTVSSNQTIRNGGGSGRIAIGSTNTRVLHQNDTLNFVINVTDVSLGGSTDAIWTADSSVVFNGFRLGGVQQNLTEATVNGTAFDNTPVSGNPGAFDTTVVVPSSNVTIVRTDNGGDPNFSDSRYRVDSMDFTITAIPEPSSLVMLAGGLFGLFGLRRRK